MIGSHNNDSGTSTASYTQQKNGKSESEYLVVAHAVRST